MATSAEVITHDQSQFEYDYDTLRTTGVILAVIMFVGGILIALMAVQWRTGRLQRQKFRLRLYRQGEERRRASQPLVHKRQRERGDGGL